MHPPRELAGYPLHNQFPDASTSPSETKAIFQPGRIARVINSSPIRADIGSRLVRYSINICAVLHGFAPSRHFDSWVYMVSTSTTTKSPVDSAEVRDIAKPRMQNALKKPASMSLKAGKVLSSVSCRSHSGLSNKTLGVNGRGRLFVTRLIGTSHVVLGCIEDLGCLDQRWSGLAGARSWPGIGEAAAGVRPTSANAGSSWHSYKGSFDRDCDRDTVDSDRIEMRDMPQSQMQNTSKKPASKSLKAGGVLSSVRCPSHLGLPNKT